MKALMMCFGLIVSFVLFIPNCIGVLGSTERWYVEKYKDVSPETSASAGQTKRIRCKTSSYEDVEKIVVELRGGFAIKEIWYLKNCEDTAAIAKRIVGQEIVPSLKWEKVNDKENPDVLYRRKDGAEIEKRLQPGPPGPYSRPRCRVILRIKGIEAD